MPIESSSSSQDSIALAFGIAYQSIIPVRKTPGHRSELVSQLLFGEQYKVVAISEDSNWIQIEIAYDGYQGWIDAKQHKEVSKEYYGIIGSMDWPITKDLIGLVHGPNKVIPIPYGCTLPVFNNTELFIDKEICKYQGEVFFPVKTNDFDFLYSVARFYIAAPYLWGGRTPFGIDCSGFVQQVFRICGHKLPRDANQQVNSGKLVSIENTEPGDLAFFAEEGKGVTHVGIVCENRNIIHASGEVRIDKIDKKGILNLDLGQYTHQIHAVKRIF